MIEEIMKLRSSGLSFRKIADELDTTVGKVQYQWKKYKKSEETKVEGKRKQSKLFMKNIIQNRYLNRKKLGKAEAEHLTAWILSGNKLFVFWHVLNVKKDLVSSYFDKPFNSFQKVLRIYDGTQILCHVSTVHPIQELKLQDGQAVSLLTKLKSDCIYIVEMGIVVSDDKFFPLLRSNSVHIPNGNRNLGELDEKVIDTLEHVQPEWADHVSTYSYYESNLKKDDRS
ncbi:DUF4912 domain-containing protein [Niallia oryzisoli]|uniref:DUF4912 domain-containing protein n=1 Tax=Niallia oryzisoli TaxID=1737571 RepID=UPI003735B320